MTHDEMRSKAEVMRLQAQVERLGGESMSGPLSGAEDMAAAGVRQRATEEI